MMCYKDRTFCKHDSCSKFSICDRALTSQVQKDAEKWWGKSNGEAPICVWVEKPECFEELK